MRAPHHLRVVGRIFVAETSVRQDDAVRREYPSGMAELDYAFLADYAVIQEGRLTAVGASFTHLAVPQLPARVEFSLAARLRVREDEPPPELEVRIAAPKSNAHLSVTGPIEAGPDSRVYDGKKGILITFQSNLLVTYEELITVDIVVNGDHARRLAFDVGTISPSAE